MQTEANKVQAIGLLTWVSVEFVQQLRSVEKSAQTNKQIYCCVTWNGIKKFYFLKCSDRVSCALSDSERKKSSFWVSFLLQTEQKMYFSWIKAIFFYTFTALLQAEVAPV